jgi:hypothetical protein
MQLGVYVPDNEYKKLDLGLPVEDYTHLDGRRFKLFKKKGHVLVYMGKTSGMVVPLRKEFTANPDTYLNEVVKVLCNDINADTFVPRNPRYQVMHEGKNSTDVTLAKHIEAAKALVSI